MQLSLSDLNRVVNSPALSQTLERGLPRCRPLPFKAGGAGVGTRQWAGTGGSGLASVLLAASILKPQTLQ